MDASFNTSELVALDGSGLKARMERRATGLSDTVMVIPLRD
jgi:hypothetical protein